MPEQEKKIALIDTLTEKQREVLALVSEGMTSKEIARKLGISESAVNQRIEVIRLRLGGMSRASIGRLYRQTHMLLVKIPTSNSITGNAIQLHDDGLVDQQSSAEGVEVLQATADKDFGVLHPSTLSPSPPGLSSTTRRIAIIIGLAAGILLVAILVLAVGHTLAVLARDFGRTG